MTAANKTNNLCVAMALIASSSTVAADAIEIVQFDITEANLSFFGDQYSADYLGPTQVRIVGASAELTYVADGALDAADLRIIFQAPSNGVPIWELLGADLGWSGSGRFSASPQTVQLNGPIDVDGDFSLFLIQLQAEGFQPLSGHFIQSYLQVEVVPLIAGDANGDCLVDVDDLIEVIVAWGDCPQPPAACPNDLDNSGAIDVDDLVEVLLNWTK